MLKRLLTAGILVLLATAVQAAGLYPLSRQQQVDANGKPLSGARLFLFDGGTATPRVGYKDLALTSAHPNPIVADAAGRMPLIYLDDGYYRHRLTSKTGTLIFDDDGLPVLTTSSGGPGTSVDPDSVYKTGDFKLAFTDQPVSGYVRANGRTIGSASSGATERANADTQPLYEFLWSFANISVSGGKGASAAADYAANKPLVLPNAAGRGLFGSDDLGAGAQSVLTSATCTGPTLPGASCGAQVITITAANLPVTSPWLSSAVTTVSGTVGITGAAHTHTGTTDAGGVLNHTHSLPTQAINQGGGAGVLVFSPTGVTGTGNTSVASAESHTHTFSIGTSGSHSHDWSGSASTTVNVGGNTSGGGTATSNLPPVLTVMILMRL